MSPRFLGYNSKQKTFVDNLWSQSQIKHAMFSFILYEYDEQPNSSFMIIGGIDDTLFRGQLHWLPNYDTIFWSLDVTHVGFGTTFGKAQGTAIIDSGTSYILCPNYVLKGIHALINASLEDAFYVVSCNEIKRMPTITLVVGNGLEIPLFPEDYTYHLSGVCYSNFMPMDPDSDVPQVRDRGKPDWILGAAFLRAYYVAFDLEESRIGIARYRHR